MITFSLVGSSIVDRLIKAFIFPLEVYDSAALLRQGKTGSESHPAVLLGVSVLFAGHCLRLRHVLKVLLIALSLFPNRTGVTGNLVLRRVCLTVESESLGFGT